MNATGSGTLQCIYMSINNIYNYRVHIRKVQTHVRGIEFSAKSFEMGFGL